jgi:phosphotransferase system HPr-like phosphotransfer protein
VSTTNREKRKQAKRKARERAKKEATDSLRHSHRFKAYAAGTPDALNRTARSRGAFHNPPPPVDAPSITLTVLDPEGWGMGSCHTAKTQVYLLYALQSMDCRVWAEHHQAGSVLVFEDGELAEVMHAAGLRFKQGETLTITAEGPDAEKALEACRVMFDAQPEERKALYRSRYFGARGTRVDVRNLSKGARG